MFSTVLEIFLPFSSNLTFLSAKSFSLKESKICRLVKGSKTFTANTNKPGPFRKGLKYINRVDCTRIPALMGSWISLIVMCRKDVENECCIFVSLLLGNFIQFGDTLPL